MIINHELKKLYNNFTVPFNVQRRKMICSNEYQRKRFINDKGEILIYLPTETNIHVPVNTKFPIVVDE